MLHDRHEHPLRLLDTEFLELGRVRLGLERKPVEELPGRLRAAPRVIEQLGVGRLRAERPGEHRQHRYEGEDPSPRFETDCYVHPRTLHWERHATFSRQVVFEGSEKS